MSMDALDVAWADLRQCFGLKQFAKGKFRSGKADPAPTASRTLQPETVTTLTGVEGAGDAACRLVCAHLAQVLREDIVPNFWSTLMDAEGRTNAADRFSLAVNGLHR